jgi:hypothetical protein
MSEKNSSESDPEYTQKLEHEGWKDLKEKPRWCTDVIFLVSVLN